MSSLLAYTVLIGLLVISNWAQCIHLISWVSTLISRWLTTSTILTLYGLVLLYLLFAVHALAVAKEGSRTRLKGTLAPYYDEDGKLQGWVREECEVGNKDPNRPPALARQDSLPLPPSRGRTVTPGPSMLSQIDPDSRLTSWDGFPNHHFRCQFTRQQVEDTSRLAVYWVADKCPGKRGSLDAVTPEKGKLSRFKCAGIIQCKAAVCTVRIAPGANIAKQTEAPCRCGSTLRHQSCKVEWLVVFYRDGAIFENSGRHDHSAYTHSLPVSKKKTLQLLQFVAKQPVLFDAPGSLSLTSDDSDSQISSGKEITQGNIEDDQSSNNDHHEEDEVDLNLNTSKSAEDMNSEDEMMLDADADEGEGDAAGR
ncbi:hypothetical protein C8R46DRAFT_1219459 [Mycena filopes]|nr:hypothetical protein C8R46DRAFT_1219459 [Mycena filopes]